MEGGDAGAFEFCGDCAVDFVMWKAFPSRESEGVGTGGREGRGGSKQALPLMKFAAARLCFWARLKHTCEITLASVNPLSTVVELS